MSEGKEIDMDIDKIINSYQLKVNAEDAKPENVAQAKDETLNKVNNVSVLAGLFDNIRTAYEMVSDSVTGKYKGVSKGTRALLAGGLAYLALPIDLVPDFIPVAGWLDDAAVLGWIFTRCADEFKKYKEFKDSCP
jgi:uncharacterized membrane protein YkvA (DUF1232 family)